MTRPLRIAMAGETIAASRTIQRVAAMRGLGHAVTEISTTASGRSYETPPSLAERIRYRLRLPADPAGANTALLKAAQSGLDLVWLDNAPVIHRATLEHARRLNPGLKLAWYCEDDMMNPRLGSRWLDRCLDLFDLWVTTKSFNALPHEMPARGVRRILVVDNCFDPALHRPVEPSAEDRARLGAEVGFIGTYEHPRAESLLHLARSGIGARVWGNGWDRMKNAHPALRIEGQPVYNQDFRAAVCSTDINLCFLRKSNRDLQTCRSVEAPACGGFMLHERTNEMERLFVDGAHAAYFGSDGELAETCRRWLADPLGRARIAAAAAQRARELNLDHAAMLARSLAELGWS